MANITTIKRDIETLSPSEAEELKQWIGRQTLDQPIDIQLKADLEAGKLDQLLNNAIAEEAAGKTTPL